MNAKNLIFATSLIALSGSVFAGDLLPFTEADNFTSSKTRAEVQAEARQAVRTNQLVVHGDLMQFDQFATAPKSAVTRADTSIQNADSAKNQYGTADHKTGS